jgi:hypothetical protein
MTSDKMEESALPQNGSRKRSHSEAEIGVPALGHLRGEQQEHRLILPFMLKIID